MKVTVVRNFNSKKYFLYWFVAEKTEELLEDECTACGNAMFIPPDLELSDYRFHILFPCLQMKPGEWCIANLNLREVK